MNITKANIVDEIALETGMTKTSVAKVIDLLIQGAGELLRAGHTIDIRGFVKLAPVAKAARTGRNPSTGVAIEIPAKTLVKATASKSLLGGA